MHKLYICQTCQRDAPLAPGQQSRGALLTRALTEALGHERFGNVLLVRVACLNGCLNPCNLALRGPRKYSLRLSRVTNDDVQAVLELLATYVHHETGDIADNEWPDGLADRLSARVPPPHMLLG